MQLCNAANMDVQQHRPKSTGTGMTCAQCWCKYDKKKEKDKGTTDTPALLKSKRERGQSTVTQPTFPYLVQLDEAALVAGDR